MSHDPAFARVRKLPSRYGAVVLPLLVRPLTALLVAEAPSQ